MKFENEELDKEMIDRLMSHSIFLKKHAPKITKEQALVLIGEAMLEKFFREFMSLWENELFPNCLLKDYEASEQEVHEWVHGDDFYPGCRLCLNKCKEVDDKMDSDMNKRLDGYLDLFDEISEKTDSTEVAIAIMHELSKDRRSAEIRDERQGKSSNAATVKQKRLMRELNIAFPEDISKKDASMMITEELGKND